MQYEVDFKERTLPEFKHLYITPLPKGEKSCDLYVFARHPNLVWKSCYLDCKLPDPTVEENRIAVHELAKEAIIKRAEGMRHYIKWFENEVNRLSKP
jgi:hypothetical protein